jgi:hypothetical protein
MLRNVRNRSSGPRSWVEFGQLRTVVVRYPLCKDYLRSQYSYMGG